MIETDTSANCGRFVQAFAASTLFKLYLKTSTWFLKEILHECFYVQTLWMLHINGCYAQLKKLSVLKLQMLGFL